MARTRAVRYERDPKRVVPSEHARRITYPSELTFGILAPASSYSRVRGLRHRLGRGSCVKVHVPSLNAPTKPPLLSSPLRPSLSTAPCLQPFFNFGSVLGPEGFSISSILDPPRLSQCLTIKVARTKHLPVSDGKDRRRRSARESIAEEI